MMRKNLLPPAPALGFLLPNLLGFFVFSFFPIVFSLVMAFTNWSLRPGAQLQAVGVRNFTDLLGASALGQPAPTALTLYALCGLGLVLCAIAYAWAALGNYKGVRLGSPLLTAAGIATIVLTTVRGGDHGFILAGLGATGLGLMILLSSQREWNTGWSTVAAAGVVICAAGLWTLHPRVWTAYAPNDLRFWQYLYNTLYLMLGIPFSIIGSLGLALLLNHRLPTGTARWRVMGLGMCVALGGLSLLIVWGLGYPNAALMSLILWLIAAGGVAFNVVSFRTLFYLPTFVSGVAIMILWKALYNPQTGPINIALAALTSQSVEQFPTWLTSYVWSKPALIMMGVWGGIGGNNMLLYLAALSNIPQELTEAAQVDGAGPWSRLRHITLPCLAPTSFFIAIMSVIGGIQGGFEQARVMTAGGPDGATTTLSYYIYNIAFQDLDFGYAAAISWVMFAIIFTLTAINWRFGKDLDIN